MIFPVYAIFIVIFLILIGTVAIVYLVKKKIIEMKYPQILQQNQKQQHYDPPQQQYTYEFYDPNPDITNQNRSNQQVQLIPEQQRQHSYNVHLDKDSMLVDKNGNKLDLYTLYRENNPNELQIYPGEIAFKAGQPISNIVLIGFGAVQKALMTLMYEKERWLLKKYQIIIIEPVDITNSEILNKIAEINEKGILIFPYKLTQDNINFCFKKFTRINSLVIDLSYRVNTSQVLKHCNKRLCYYINTAIDHWNFSLTPLYDTKQEILNNNKQFGKTAILNFGANPGLISIFVKHSLDLLAKGSNNKDLIIHQQKEEYNHLAKDLGLTMIQISERDNQQEKYQQQQLLKTSERQFVNTWSVVGFLDEAFDTAQISLGTHETHVPKYTNKQYLEESGQVVFNKLGHELKTISFEPSIGTLIGMNIPHAECYSLVDFLRIGNEYRPSIHYSYLPSDNCKLITHYRDFSVNKQTLLPELDIVLKGNQIEQGIDSLGALMYFRDSENNLKTLWTGSIVTQKDTKDLGSEINPTTLQVAIGTLSAIMWMLQPENDSKGILEPEQLPASQIIDYCKPYLGTFLVNHDCTIDYKPKSDKYMDLLVYPSDIKNDFISVQQLQ